MNRTVIIRSDLEKITAPVLIIHGELDLACESSPFSPLSLFSPTFWRSNPLIPFPFCHLCSDPISVATDLERDMQEAGVKAQIYLVDAPQLVRFSPSVPSLPPLTQTPF